MKDRFNRFRSNVNNQFVEVSDNLNTFQCMDLAYCWIFSLNIPKATIQRLYAYEVFSSPSDLTKQYFDIIPNSPTNTPPVGSLVVWKKGFGGSIAGHIGIASVDADVNRFKSFDQNLPLKSKAHLEEHNYDMVHGWLIPKVVSTEPVIDWGTKIPQIIENGQPLEVQQIFAQRAASNVKIAELSEIKTKVHEMTK